MAWAVAGVAAAGAAWYFLRPRPAPKVRLLESRELTLRRPGGKPNGAMGDESFTEVDDFDYEIGAHKVDAQEIFKLGALPYGLDMDRECVIMVLADCPATSLEDKEVFLYQQQRVHATRVWLIPFVEFCDAADLLIATTDGASLLKRVLFVHSTGRCGSTLLSKMLAAMSNVCSLAEPDIYSHLSVFAVMHEAKLPRSLVGRLARAATFLHARPGAAADIVAIKTRSMAVHAADAFHAAIPEAKTVFLYRGLLATVDSYCMAFFSAPVNRFTRAVGIDSWFLFKSNAFAPYVPAIAPLVRDPRFSADPALYTRLGAVGLTGMMWLAAMDTAARLQAQGVFDAVLRYEELVVQRFALVGKLLQACSLPGAPVDDATAARVMSEDSHGSAARTASSRRRTSAKGPLFVTPEEEQALQELLRRHGGLDAPLAGTMGLD
eukprot:m.57994 g.57994  ORF g.57994 m.57994 type:complete len:435 (+) comp12148_c1_seq1:66-1370(+)